MTESNADTLYDYISEESGNAQATGNAQNKVGNHREFKIRASKSKQQLYLTFVDDEAGKYNIPLGQASSHERTTGSDAQNLLVPIIPAVYTTPDLDPVYARVPRANSYIYIYKGDYLWRELEVQQNGKYKDVNLHCHQGKNIRAATVEIDSRIIVPHKIDGNEIIISLCYSEIQWSWARINSMGGMDPKDFRINQSSPPLLAPAYGITKDMAASNRAARMQEIDLSGYDASFPNIEAVDNKAKLENSNSVTAENYLLKLHDDSNIPVVYLHDPMGIAMANVQDYYNVNAEFMGFIKKAKNTAHFKSAVIAYHTFFNEKLWSRSTKNRRGHTRYVENTEAGNMFRKAAGDIDRPYLEETLLNVTARKNCRTVLRDIKKIHVAFLEGQYDGKNIVDSHPDFVTVNAAIKDYAELNGSNYIVLWSVINAFIGFLNYDPTVVDASLDLDVNRDKPNYADDPGSQYMESLLNPSHELHSILFPKKTDVDEFIEDYDISGNNPEPADGSGNFRPVAFAAIFNPSLLVSRETWKAFDDIIKYADKVVSEFGLAFKAQWQRRTELNIEANVIIRLTKSANIPEFKGLHIVPKGSAIGNKTIIDAKVTTMRPILSKVSNLVAENEKGFIKVIDPETKATIGYLDPKQVPNYKGAPMQFTQSMWDEMFVNNASGSAIAKVDLTVVSATSKYALDWHNPGLAKDVNVERMTNGLKFAGKYLPAMVAVMEVFNLVSANTEMKKNLTAKNVVKLTVGTLGLIHASVSTAVALTSEEKMGQLFEHGFRRTAGRFGFDRATQKSAGATGKYLMTGKHFLGFRVSFMAGTGALLSGAGAVMSSWDAFDSFSSNDDDAGAAYSIQAVAMGGLLITGLVEGGVVFLGMGPVGWALLAVGIIAGILATVLTDTPLEKWAKHGPFAKQVLDRMTAELSNKTRDNAGNDITTPKSEQDTLEALMDMLMRPSIVMKKETNTKPHSIVVEMTAPGFSVSKSTLEIHSTMSERYRYGHNSTRYRNETVIVPIATENLVDNETGVILGIKYYYALPANGSYKFETRGRHITAEQIYIPKQVSVEHAHWEASGTNRRPSLITSTDTISNTSIDQKDANWVYAKPMITSQI